MIYGVIDLGSNTIRLSVFKYQNNRIKLVQNKKAIVGLASCIKNGGLTEEGVIKTCNVLNLYKTLLAEQGIKEFSIFATASLRNINNKDAVLSQIKEKTGLVPEVLFGDEEARLDFIGVKNSCELNRGILVDIGGGSTEIVLFENGEIKRLTSVPIGALNLQTKVVKGVIPTEKEIKRMKKVLNKTLDELKWDFENDYEMMYAIGGSSRAALEIAKELFEIPQTELSFTKSNLKAILGKIKSVDPADYKKVYKIVPERIFSLAGGIVILNEILNRFGCKIITISKNGIREGYFIDRVISELKEEKTLEEIVEKTENTAENIEEIKENIEREVEKEVEERVEKIEEIKQELEQEIEKNLKEEIKEELEDIKKDKKDFKAKEIKGSKEVKNDKKQK